ncbi:stage VI sporulation protein D [Radiobacillus kanasensis]|uniref:stage VI sporulation protein D n=1 Tax=Radiobacillus kanasensis TaxID=2844358 RepID=UPI001E41F9E7|nr:stage VI sporulation protein D [Radiobacillus kanasensis]UFT97939.1 stage VI sporulation protein D [Radiobacillus kanasensis]
MLTDGQSVFTFDLNESLWFKKGQEVEEIMGISLDPEISIQEYEDFVSIRGVIELKGEYFQVQGEVWESDDILTLRDHPSQRMVERVESYDDGVNEFFHTFPVEVSIPNYRIHELDDVMVGIESFDYELPENSQLKLMARIAIHGVLEESNSYEATAEDRDLQTDNNYADANDEAKSVALDETFQFDVKNRSEQQPEPEPDFAEDFAEPPLDPALEDEIDVLDEVEEELEQKEEKVEVPAKEKGKKKKSQSLAEFFAATAKGKGSDETAPLVEEKPKQLDVTPEELLREEREEVDAPDPTYLLNMFEEAEEQYTRVRMCIVQQSDTLDTIAERYEVSPLVISNKNGLLSDDIKEGQILYIPSK